MNIMQRPSPNRSGRQNHTPDFIVCHIDDGTFDGTLSWITNPKSQVSYHFVVARDGRIAQTVQLTDMSWANGTTNSNDNRDNRHSTVAAIRDRRINANLYSISIGFEGRHAETQGALTEAQLNAGMQLIRHIRSEVQRLFNFTIPFARTNLIGHNEVTPRTRPNCPGAQFPWNELIRRLNANVVPPQQSQQPSEWAREPWEWAMREGITDGTRPRDNITREEAVTMLFRARGK